MSDQIAVLQSIAAFAARLRGHTLGKWRTGDTCSVARCIHCGRVIEVYRAAIQPEMDGAALTCECEAAVHASAA